jgi:hypothetical protein
MFAVLVLSLSALGQIDGDPDNWCREGFYTRDSSKFFVGSVVGKKGSRSYIYDDLSEKCPQDESCRTKAYLVPGDKVVVSREFNNFACIWFSPAKGLPTIGWLKAGDIRPVANALEVTLRSWLGKWKYGNNSITFTDNKLEGWLNVTGDAMWKGLGDNVHVGELDDRVEPKDGVVKVGENETGEYACKVTMRFMGGFLVVADNMHCGGVNVTFSGVYIKQKYRVSRRSISYKLRDRHSPHSQPSRSFSL